MYNGILPLLACVAFCNMSGSYCESVFGFHQTPKQEDSHLHPTSKILDHSLLAVSCYNDCYMSSIIWGWGNMTEIRVPRWWMGGVASAAAACFTQPLDTIKVHQQTQQDVNHSIVRLTMNVIKQEGVLSLNHGLTAAVLRQLTYSTTRFAVYEAAKEFITKPGEKISFSEKIGIAAVGGIIGGFIGTPADLMNIRMQNDIKLPPAKRRNYRHAFDGIWRVYKEEGFRQLFCGASTATGRSVLMTIGQLSCYDQFKTMLLDRNFADNLTTHFLASLAAVSVDMVTYCGMG
ncbi:mitochondrial dicarboxylate carrier isoform X2 [Cryptotermes secundus]|uniref:mitochondrial dicarboxylate carrier isoform X2 n=1 Tax=Cryptotermes secundus TaxID=105785 RepID=UPI000CD7C963|nr:mitochondrial dicarboxylate carrier isoform X2 [Cryptotermes secundus]